jgi:hypothetical protein
MSRILRYLDYVKGSGDGQFDCVYSPKLAWNHADFWSLADLKQATAEVDIMARARAHSVKSPLYYT